MAIKPSSKRKSSHKKQQKRDQQAIKKRNMIQLKAFNRLLKDIYGVDYYFSMIVSSAGILEHEIIKIKNSPVKLQVFIKRFLGLLEIKTSKFASAIGFIILNKHYGLDGKLTISDGKIADELNLTEQNVIDQRITLIKQYSSNEGRKIVEKMVLEAFIHAK